jgi:hypothetical protein
VRPYAKPHEHSVKDVAGLSVVTPLGWDGAHARW